MELDRLHTEEGAKPGCDPAHPLTESWGRLAEEVHLDVLPVTIDPVECGNVIGPEGGIAFPTHDLLVDELYRDSNADLVDIEDRVLFDIDP